MHRSLIWDLPVRVFHWVLAGTIIAILAIALGIDDESAVFPVHMLLGLIAGAMVLLRLVWGLVGSRYARFRAFLFGPRALWSYLQGTIKRSPAASRWLGHNPGSSYAIYAMLALILALAVTGPLIARGFRSLKELHELLAYALLGVSIAHVAGVVWHSMHYRENLVRSMIDGTKAVASPTDGIRSAHPGIALAFIACVAGLALTLFTSYDFRSRTLRLPFVQLTFSPRKRPAMIRHERDHSERHEAD